MEIKGDMYRVWYDPARFVVSFAGTLRVNSQGYQSIEGLLGNVVLSSPKSLTLDMRMLDFLNSSGINVLYKFVSANRALPIEMRISRNIPWQSMSFPNLSKFSQNFKLVLCD